MKLAQFLSAIFCITCTPLAVTHKQTKQMVNSAAALKQSLGQ